MLTFIRAQAAFIIGSASDFLLTILLVEIFHCWYPVASLAGNIAGAISLFLLCKTWVFHSTKGRFKPQAFRFILVYSGNIVLSFIGIYLFTNFARVEYILSKLMVSIILGTTYNYILQKKFVFNQPHSKNRLYPLSEIK